MIWPPWADRRQGQLSGSKTDSPLLTVCVALTTGSPSSWTGDPTLFQRLSNECASLTGSFVTSASRSRPRSETWGYMIRAFVVHERDSLRSVPESRACAGLWYSQCGSTLIFLARTSWSEESGELRVDSRCGPPVSRGQASHGQAVRRFGQRIG